MYTGKLVFSQVMEHLPLHIFHQCVSRYSGDFKVKEFTCLDQYLCMAFAQLTYWERAYGHVEACLRSQQNKLYHTGIRSSVSRNTLANANDSFGLELQNTVYALNATTIDLCLSMFPWANFRKNKGAVRLHTQLELKGSVPSFLHISDGKLREVNTLGIIPLEAGAFYIMDRCYLDFERLYNISLASAFFVIRAKSNLKCRRVYSHQVDKSAGLICDQSLLLTGYYQSKDYPEKLRRVKYYDAENDKTLVFLTNNFSLPAMTIAELYR